MATKTRKNAPAAAPRPEPTPDEKRALEIEAAEWTERMCRKSAREAIDEALVRLHRLVEEIERDAQRPEYDLSKVLYSFRHNLAWGAANIESNLATADSQLLAAIVAQTKREALSSFAETTTASEPQP